MNQDNILTVPIGDKAVIAAGTLYQYDYGQRLVFTGVDLPMSYEVHFANRKSTASVTMIGDATGVDIPDALLQTGEDIFAYIYLHTGADDGETEYQIVITVSKRAMPTHETPTPVQQSEIEQAIAALESGVEAIEDAVEAAEVAEAAKEAAEDAQTAAETAQGKAEDAQTAAETAQDAAEAAQEAAETAQGKAEDAQEAAETAKGKAEDAQTAAETAQGKAEDAQEAAEAAQEAAEDAQDAAEDAQDAAEAAQAVVERAVKAYKGQPAENGIITITDATEGTFRMLQASVKATQSSGTKCPVASKNMLNAASMVNSYFTDQGSNTYKAQLGSNHNYSGYSNTMALTSGQQYTFSFGYSSIDKGTGTFAIQLDKGTGSSQTVDIDLSSSQSYGEESVTFTASGAWTRMRLIHQSVNQYSYITINGMTKLQLEIGSGTTPYEEYRAQVILPISDVTEVEFDIAATAGGTADHTHTVEIPEASQPFWGGIVSIGSSGYSWIQPEYASISLEDATITTISTGIYQISPSVAIAGSSIQELKCDRYNVKSSATFGDDFDITIDETGETPVFRLKNTKQTAEQIKAGGGTIVYLRAEQGSITTIDPAEIDTLVDTNVISSPDGSIILAIYPCHGSIEDTMQGLKEDAEAWTTGQRNGQDVPATDETYENNAKYYALLAAEILSSKADKVSSAVSGNFAGLNSNGDLTDSGKSASDFADAEDFEDAQEDIEALNKSKAAIISDEMTTPAEVMTIPDGADGMPMALEIEIAPAQDLHGYSYPWVGGAGKNKFDIGTIFSDTSKFTINGNAVTGTASNLASVSMSIPNELVGQQLTFSANINVPSSAGSGYMRTRAVVGGTNKNGNVISAGAPGLSKVTFTPASTSDTVVFAYGSMGTNSATISEIQLEIGSTNTTFAPYSNICLISGWTGTEITRTNNLLDDDLITLESGKYIDSTNGSISSANGFQYVADYLPLSSGLYTIKCDKTATQSRGIYAIFYDANKAFIEGITVASNTFSTGNIQGTFTVPVTAKYTRFDIPTHTTGSLFLQAGSAITITTSETDTYHITFPNEAGTVYGGTLTINKDGTGTLVSDLKKVTYNGTENWKGTTNAFYLGISNDYLKDADAKGVCDSYKFVGGISGAGALSENGTIGMYTGASYYRIYVRDDQYADVDAFKSALTSNSITVCYELATPVTYNLTAEIIESLKGINNIYADTGKINSVDYSADTKLYIDKELTASRKLMELIVTANREDSMKATKAYTTGNLLIVNGTLYKATTSIANGATLTIGTNVTATTVAAEIAALA